MPRQSLLKILLGLLSASVTNPTILTKKPRSPSRSESASFSKSDSLFLLLQRDCLVPRHACAQPPPRDLGCFHLCLQHHSHLLPVWSSKTQQRCHFLWRILVESPCALRCSPDTHRHPRDESASPHGHGLLEDKDAILFLSVGLAQHPAQWVLVKRMSE